MVSGIPRRVLVNACSHGVEQLRLTKQVWPLPQVPAPVRPVAHTICCRPTLPLAQCHEAKRTVPNGDEQGANSTTDNISEGQTDESSDASSERTCMGCDLHSKQEPTNQLSQQVVLGGHSLCSPRSGEESWPCVVHPQPAIPISPAVLTHSTPVTPRSPLLPLVHWAPPALKFSVLSCSSMQEPSGAPDGDSSKKRPASVTSQMAM